MAQRGQPVRKLWCVIDKLRLIFSVVVVVLFCVMMGSVLAQVGGRYLFSYTTAWATELSTFCQVWLVLLGGGIAMARNQHLAIDLLPAQLPLPYARAASIMIALVILTFLGAMAYGSIPLVKLGLMQTSPAMGTPMWMIYACLPVSALYMALEVVSSVNRNWDDPFAVPAILDAEAG